MYRGAIRARIITGWNLCGEMRDYRQIGFGTCHGVPSTPSGCEFILGVDQGVATRFSIEACKHFALHNRILFNTIQRPLPG